MKHPWMRASDLASSLGLILGAIGIIIVGFQLKNIYIIMTAFFCLFF